MKQLSIRILTLCTIVGISSQLIAMQHHNFHWVDQVVRDARDANQQHQQKIERKAAERASRRAELEVTLRRGSETEKQYALRELERLGKEDDAANKFKNVGEDFVGKMANTYADAVGAVVHQAEKAQEAELKKEQIAIKGEMKRRAVVDGIKEAFKSFGEPKTAASAGLCALGIFGSYYGLKFAFQVLEDWYGVPELADKTTIIPFHKQIYNKIMGIQVFNKTRDDIVLNNELKEFMNEYIEGTKNIIAHGGYLNHVLFPGPPGTGKTLMAEVIAHELGLPSIYFAASNLLNCDTEKALVRISQLFTYAKSSPTPIVIIMDEAEMIFGDRNKAASEKVSTIKNQIMANTGTEQNNFVLIALTNRLQDFDKAFKSRFNNIVEVAPPAYAQRKQILELYVNSYIKNPKFKTKGTFLGKLFTKKDAKKITYDEKLFSAQGIEALAKQLDGFTGRNISHFVMDIRKKALASTNAAITQVTVDKALAAMKAKVAEEQREFAAGAAGK